MKSQILTERQQDELNKAIVQYLSNTLNGESIIIENISNLLQVQNIDGVVPNYLEKKWSTVIRLQKKIMDLETEVGNLRTIVDSHQNNSNDNSNSNGIFKRNRINWLPISNSTTFNTQSNQLILCTKFHPTLPIVFAGSSDGSLIVWNIVNDENTIPEKIIKAHARGINKLAWSNNPIDLSSSSTSSLESKFYILASCSADLTIKIWNGSTYRHIRTLTGHEHTVSSVIFSPTNSTILYSVSRDKTVKVWNLLDGYCLRSFVGHSDWVRDIDIANINSTIMLSNIQQSNKLGDFILTCSNDQSIRLSHADTGTALAFIVAHTHVVETVKFLPLTSNFILDKYLNNYISEFPNIPSDLINNISYTDILGFKYCISGGRDNLVKLFLLPPPTLTYDKPPSPTKYNNGMGFEIASMIGHTAWVKALAIHPNGKYIFSASEDKTIRIWDLNTLNTEKNIKCIRILTGHEGFINSIDFAKYSLETIDTSKIANEQELYDTLLKQIESKMKCLFISGGTDNSVRLWN
ncbi:WD40-repeat-containing domain protein [Scheffersomyces amazonensis]|uniref:WD40-repeat-containing domain protein n=1 Tax=Scheffersomyces amazonensis TaxID=1078765 RepID=UPI00315D5700